MSTKGNRAIDMLITYRVLKILTTPFEKQDAFKFGIIDKDGKVLRRYKDVSKSDEKKTYTWLHRFVFNVKRLLGKAGLGGRLGSLGVALALLLKEENYINRQPKKIRKLMEPSIGDYKKYDKVFESAVIKYCVHIGVWDTILNEDANLSPTMTGLIQEKFEKNPVLELTANYFGCDIFENEDKSTVTSSRSNNAMASFMIRGETV